MLCTKPTHFVYHGVEIPLLNGDPVAESFIKDFGLSNSDGNPDKLSDTEIKNDPALKEIETEKLDALLGRYYERIEASFHKVTHLSSQDFHRRPKEKMRALMERWPSPQHGIRSMVEQTEERQSLPEEDSLNTLSIYESLYSRRQTMGTPAPSSPTLADKICIAETELGRKDWETHFATLCLQKNPLSCDEIKYVALTLTHRCLATKPIQQALKILWNYDEEIRQVAKVIAQQHPELKSSNIRLLLYSILILEATELRPHDIWQDVSACNWEEDGIGVCNFADQIETVVFETPHKIYKDNALKKGIKKYIFNSPPSLLHQWAWRIASSREETHRKKQGFGLGQIILGLALKAANDPEAFEPFVRAGLLAPEQFASEKAVLNTILNPETFIYAKGLTLNYAITYLKRTRLKESEAAFPSDSGSFITDDVTARELTLLASAEIMIRFPDESTPIISAEEVNQSRIEHTLTGLQDEVSRLFLTAYLLEEQPDTPSLTMIPTASMDLLDAGAGYWDRSFGYIGGPKAQNFVDESAQYFHWVPPGTWYHLNLSSLNQN